MLRIFVRHCFFSEASASKTRPPHFQRKKLHEQLLSSLRGIPCTLTILLDKNGKEEKHFTELEDYFNIIDLKAVQYTVQILHAGCEAESFLQTLDYLYDQASHQKFDKNDLIVLLEDDYAVSPNWTSLVPEGLQFADYVTLYDHPDKYELEIYKNIQSKVFKGSLCHWRTTPSTTNSFATSLKTLLDDMELQKQYSTNVKITLDHFKFLQLWSKGKTLVSCIPGAWSHEELHMQDLKVSQASETLSRKFYHVQKESEEPILSYFF
jgi:hypothetical protein